MRLFLLGRKPTCFSYWLFLLGGHFNYIRSIFGKRLSKIAKFWIVLPCLSIAQSNAAPGVQTKDSVDARYVYSWENSVNKQYFKTADTACLSHGLAASGDKGQYTDTYSGGRAAVDPVFGAGCVYDWKRTDNTTGNITDSDSAWFGQDWFESWAMCPEGYTFNSASGSCELSRTYDEKSCPFGNPIYPGKGNKIQYEVDYLGPSLSFSRQFASWHQGGNYSNGLGANWFIKTYHRYLEFLTEDGVEYVYAVRKLGRKHLYTKSGASYTAAAGINNSLSFDAITNLYQYTDKKQLVNEFYSIDGKLQKIEKISGQSTTLYYSDVSTPVSVASSEGLLIKVEDTFGRSLQFSYDVNNYLVEMIDANGKSYQYEYDAEKLVKVIYPDNTSKTYHYKDNPAYTINQLLGLGYSIAASVDFDSSYDSENLPGYFQSKERVANPLSGVTDENGVRFSTYDYDAQGRGVSTKLAGGVNKYQFSFDDTEYRTTVTNALGKSTEIIYQTTNNKLLVKKKNGNATPNCAATSVDTTYEWNGYAKYKTDAKGVRTRYFRNSRGLVTNEYQAYQTAEVRSTRTYWHSEYQLPTKILYPDRQVDYQYDSSFRVKQIDQTDRVTGEVRTTRYTYDQYGHVLTSDGPREDVNDTYHYAYNSLGDLTSITNPLGHVSSISLHDTDGRPLTFVDSNGIATKLTYNTRGKLIKIDTAGRITQFVYDNAGLLTSTSLPNGTQIQYEYDDAHRLVAIQDGQANRIEYTLDLMGNRLQTEIKNNTGQVTKLATQIFDELSRINKASGANGQETELSYDVNDNLVNSINPLDNSTVQSFDTLNRLIETVEPDDTKTGYSYDSLDRLTSVTDAENKTTSYEYNAFGDLTKLTSPDTGITTFTYDKASNLLTKTDARGITVTFTYDALNRVITQSYSDASENITYTYDDISNGNKGVGRLTSVADQSGSTSFVYDGFGNVTKETRIIESKTYVTEYHFDTNGQMTGITHPSGRVLTYSFDTLGRVNGLTSDYQSQTKTLASNLTYLPFGPMNNLTYGNGKVLTQTFDSDYRLTGKSVTGISEYSYGYDVTNNITSISNTLDAANDELFTYDKLSRLLTADGGYDDLSFSYDKVSNRLSKTENTNTETYVYDTNSHRLTSTTGVNPKAFTHDAVGNTLTKDGLTFTYNHQGRMATVAKTGMNVNYLYNFKGERSSKLVNSVKTHFIYNLQGQLIAEADTNGTITQEYIYLNGQRLASVNNGALYYVHTSHLDTPLALTDEAGTVQWQAHYTPFGKVIVDVDNVTQAARFPGQYLDEETGLYYNYFRDYDSEVGRYIQSDPIGLNGGINTYGYVGGDPVNYFDFYGLKIGTVDRVFWPHIRRIRSTSKGKELWDLMESNDALININRGKSHCENKTNAHLDKNGNVIKYDIFVYTGNHDHLKLAGIVGGERTPFTPSTTRVLAHEMGHTTGTFDDGGSAIGSTISVLFGGENSYQMNNINDWENPIMTPLDGITRTNYAPSSRSECSCD